MVTDFKCYFHLPFGISMIFYGCSSLINRCSSFGVDMSHRAGGDGGISDSGSSCSMDGRINFGLVDSGGVGWFLSGNTGGGTGSLVE